MIKYFHITITTPLNDSNDYYTYFKGNNKDEIYCALYDFIEDNLDEVATAFFDSDEISKRGMSEAYYFHETAADYDEITEDEYRKNLNQMFGNLD